LIPKQFIKLKCSLKPKTRLLLNGAFFFSSHAYYSFD
jgi:hypothetical protein